MAHDVTAGRAFDRRANPTKLACVQTDGSVAERLIKDISAVPDTDESAVAIGFVVGVVGGDQTAGAIHVLNHKTRIAGNMLAHVTCEQPRIGVIAASGGEAYRDSNRLTCVEIIGNGLRSPAEHQRP